MLKPPMDWRRDVIHSIWGYERTDPEALALGGGR